AIASWRTAAGSAPRWRARRRRSSGSVSWGLAGMTGVLNWRPGGLYATLAHTLVSCPGSARHDGPPLDAQHRPGAPGILRAHPAQQPGAAVAGPARARDRGAQGRDPGLSLALRRGAALSARGLQADHRQGGGAPRPDPREPGLRRPVARDP